MNPRGTAVVNVYAVLLPFVFRQAYLFFTLLRYSVAGTVIWNVIGKRNFRIIKWARVVSLQQNLPAPSRGNSVAMPIERGTRGGIGRASLTNKYRLLLM